MVYIHVGFAKVTGSGLVTIAKEAAYDGVKRHAKRYIGGILIDTGLTCVLGGLPIVTNTTKVVKYSKAIHSVYTAFWPAAHNIAELPLRIVDCVVFGKYVTLCGSADYDVYD